LPAPHGGVDAVGTVDDRFDGVGEGQLLVVVGVDADLLAGALERLAVLLDQHLDLLGVERAEAVDDHDGAGRSLDQHLQRLRHLRVLHGRNGHQVAGDLVALVVGVVDHVDRDRDLMHVGGDPDQVERALLLGENVRVVVGLLRVGHHRELERRVVLSDDPAHVVLVAVLPGAELGGREELLGCLVAHLHVIDAGLDARLVHGLDEAVVEHVVVDQASVANGAVENLDFRTIRDPGCAHFRFLLEPERRCGNGAPLPGWLCLLLSRGIPANRDASFCALTLRTRLTGRRRAGRKNCNADGPLAGDLPALAPSERRPADPSRPMILGSRSEVHARVARARGHSNLASSRAQYPRSDESFPSSFSL
jgi:hypothetical protein